MGCCYVHNLQCLSNRWPSIWQTNDTCPLCLYRLHYMSESEIYYALTPPRISANKDQFSCLLILNETYVKCEEREKTNKMQKSDVYYQLLSQHVSGIIMPIFTRTKTVCYCIRCTELVLLLWGAAL